MTYKYKEEEIALVFIREKAYLDTFYREDEIWTIFKMDYIDVPRTYLPNSGNTTDEMVEMF